MIPQEQITTHFTGIRSQDVRQYADLLAPLISKPLKRTDAGKYYSVQDVLDKCASAEWQCWIAWHGLTIDAVFVTYIAPFPTGFRSFVVYLVGGSNIDEWLDVAWVTFKAYAKQSGCGEINGLGRPGWTRALRRVEDKPIEKHLRFSVEI